MSKCILVIDTPNSCAECNLFSGIYCDMTCRGNGRGIDYPYPNNKIQNWCPLKKIPEKKQVRSFNIGTDDFEQKGYQIGWNACIDEILKGD